MERNILVWFNTLIHGNINESLWPHRGQIYYGLRPACVSPEHAS